MNKVWKASAWAVIAVLMVACEEEFIPDVTTDSNALVVEGYIEGGDNPLPPYVLLTKSFPFFSELSQEEVSNSFVHDAVITVSDGEKSVTLTELCINDLSPAQRELLANFIGTTADSIGFNICAYTDLSFTMLGEIGKTYTLQIEANGQQLSAVTTIPTPIPLDSLRFTPPPGIPNDTLAQLEVFIQDPIGVANYYRYFTGTDDGPLLRPFASVIDDQFFDGQGFHFPLSKAEDFNDSFDPETFGLYRIGTTANIKWMSIDEQHFNFWNTLEFSRSNQGPFSSYTRVDHNIEGGLGIWGGIAARYYSLEVRY
ncbi:MAG: DUF4249 domain-containing protein [Saprospiraceae bacterium]